MSDSLAAPPSQADFACALLDRQRPCPSGLRTTRGVDASTRFAVHRNNIVVSLVEALGESFAVTRQLVGEPFFAAMAGVFVRQSPPRSPVLALYGDGFASFIQAFEPAAVLPYLADVAQLEYLRARALHAADAEVLGAADIARLRPDPAALPTTRLTLHPSAAVLASRHAVVALWAAHHGAVDIAAVDPDVPQCALVLRQGDAVGVIAVDAGSAVFFQCLIDGATLGEASAAAVARAGDGFDLAASLATLLGHGALSGWHAPSESTPP